MVTFGCSFMYWSYRPASLKPKVPNRPTVRVALAFGSSLADVDLLDEHAVSPIAATVPSTATIRSLVRERLGMDPPGWVPCCSGGTARAGNSGQRQRRRRA